MVSVNYLLLLSAVLFLIGAAGVLVRRNALVIYMSIELMLNAANLAFVAFAANFGALDGQIAVFFVMTVAAAEVAVGLALVLQVYAKFKPVDTDAVNSLASTPLPTASPSATPMAQDPATRGGI